jgi:cell wall-associated NlpC family hydrolase
VTFDSVAAVQTRIAQIQQLISGSAPGVGGSRAPAAAPTQSPEFASLLADAMGTGTSTDPLSSPLSAPSTDASGTATGAASMVSQLMKLSQLASTPTGSAATTASNPTTQLFLSNAMAEKGKPYVYGATASISDPNPRAFDCSELTKWAAARAGVTIPDGATAQYLSIRDHGGTMSVQQALHTPGALLFHFGHEPKDLGDIPADGHVAISLGDGVHTIEARGHAYGTDVFDNAGGRSFNFAGMIPGMS